ncbi:MAG TPA: hypothetical protein PKV21_06480, partial [bacterium]|nr:hypothetical protein [bacterium]
MINGSLKYWLDGEPFITDTDEDIGKFKYWLDGEPFINYEKLYKISTDDNVQGTDNFRSKNSLKILEDVSLNELNNILNKKRILDDVSLNEIEKLLNKIRLLEDVNLN